jgi:aminoglycoside phosphotransferase (APT) family kinase protein
MVSTDDGGNPARPVRDEDAFDVEAVADWLREHATLPEGWAADDLAGTPQVRQFPGGASNLTYLLRYPARDLILRRPPAGAKAASAHDMGREFRIQSALAPVFPYVPRMIGFCRDEAVIGSDFYVMEKLDGTILRRELPWPLTDEEASTLCADALDVLVALHSVDVDAVPELARLGRGEGYVARQVGGWVDRFAKARTDDTGDWSDIVAWIEAHQPADVAQRLIHNDFRLDNLVLAPDDRLRIVGVLDWEMATVGDPLMDLGGMLSYWVEADDDEFFQMFRRQPTTEPGMWTRAEFVERYCERMGFALTPEQWRFYEVFGLFRLAVIAQQIWYRYFHQQTTNEAYAVFGPAVGYLEERCRRLVSTSSTSEGPRSTSEGPGSTSEGPGSASEHDGDR